MEDRRSTPPHLRIPALLLLAFTILYLLGGYRMALSEMSYASRPAALRPQVQPWFWAAQFHMFNEPRPNVTVVQATVLTDQGEVSVDLPSLYPTLREEGPSYARSRFMKDSERVALMGQDICRKTGGRKVRIWLENHSKLSGVQTETVELGRWNCG